MSALFRGIYDGPPLSENMDREQVLLLMEIDDATYVPFGSLGFGLDTSLYTANSKNLRYQPLCAHSYWNMCVYTH